jgi:hypothetical protein
LRLARNARATLARLAESLGERDRELARALAQGVVPYDLVVHAQTDLQFKANLEQSGSFVGDTITVRASLREYDVPVDKRATVWAEAVLPNGAATSVSFGEVEPGEFEGTLPMTQSGLYVLRIRAQGETFRGRRFAREQTLTGAAYPAGYQEPTGHEGEPSELCQILKCLLDGTVVTARAEERLKQFGIDVERLGKCLMEHCFTVTPATLERAARNTISRPKAEVRRTRARRARGRR